MVFQICVRHASRRRGIWRTGRACPVTERGGDVDCRERGKVQVGHRERLRLGRENPRARRGGPKVGSAISLGEKKPHFYPGVVEKGGEP